MRLNSPIRVLFLAWENLWPTHSGAALRNWGLLQELSKAFAVDLVMLARRPLSAAQTAVLTDLTQSITWVPLKDKSWVHRGQALWWIIRRGYTYHHAVLERSFQGYSDLQRMIIEYPGIVLAVYGHWGILVYHQRAPNWILDQHIADVEYWRVRTSELSSPLARLAAQINYRLAQRIYPRIYANVARVISVCEEDRQHTLALAPNAQVDVVENGVDCSYYVPSRVTRTGPPRLLFTGTSLSRNMKALHQFADNVLPLIQREVPDIELLVGGNFHAKAQAEFAAYPHIRFTGRVDDMRPAFNQSDVSIIPFNDAHGSKLKVSEAMAMAMPIVSTHMGVRGFPLVDGESVLIAHSDQEFAMHTVALLRDAERRSALGDAARRIALSTIDWRILGKRLVSIVEMTHEAWKQKEK